MHREWWNLLVCLFICLWCGRDLRVSVLCVVRLVEILADRWSMYEFNRFFDAHFANRKLQRTVTPLLLFKFRLKHQLILFLCVSFSSHSLRSHSNQSLINVNGVPSFLSLSSVLLTVQWNIENKSRQSAHNSLNLFVVKQMQVVYRFCIKDHLKLDRCRKIIYCLPFQRKSKSSA